MYINILQKTAKLQFELLSHHYTNILLQFTNLTQKTRTLKSASSVRTKVQRDHTTSMGTSVYFIYLLRFLYPVIHSLWFKGVYK